jgi:hypothetical protein
LYVSTKRLGVFLPYLRHDPRTRRSDLADFLLWYDGNLNPARGRDVEQARATARDYLYPDGE